MRPSAKAVPQRRGACPGLSDPMPTGDGLLVRLMPIGTVAVAAFIELCAAARAHGNGVIEITSRGSIQARGLSGASAPRFASAIAALGIAASDGVPVLSNALAGLDAAEILDAIALAAALRRELERRPMAKLVGAKVSVAIDGGGALNLDGLAADIRLRVAATNSGKLFGVAVGGDAVNATQIGFVTPAQGVEAATRLLEILARRGRHMRAHDIVAAEGAAVFRAAIADLLLTPNRTLDGGDPAPDPRSRRTKRKVETHRSNDAIGSHRLRDGSFAHGIGLAFGHADAATLEHLAERAVAAGASGVRTAPGRVLMAIGLTQQTASSFAAAAEQLGFITRPDDPRRHIVACAGAPICASAHIAARALGPLIAQTAAPYLDGSFAIHVSGCTKGCAHPAPAALTIAGTSDGCALISDGSARDTPFTVVRTRDLSAIVARYAREHKRGGRHA